MDLITSAVTSVLAFIASIIGNILAQDICTSANRICAKIIHRASLSLAPFDQTEVEQEWLGDLHERETVREKYQHAIGCFIAAPKMRRRAMTIRIDVKLRISTVGVVPFKLTIDPVYGERILNWMGHNRWGGKQLTFIAAVYHAAKVLRAAGRLGPGSVHRLIGELKNVKAWDIDVKVSRKGLDMDLSKIANLYVRDRVRGREVLQKFSEQLLESTKRQH